MKTSIVAAAFGSWLLAGGVATAAETAAPAPAPTTVMKPGKAAMESHAMDCLKEAEVMGLHGKERRKFLTKCKKGEK